MRILARALPLALASLLAILGAHPGVDAAERAGAGRRAAAQKPLEDRRARQIVAQLASGRPELVATALAVVTEQGPAAAMVAPAIEALLEKGASASVLRASIDALAAIGASRSSAAIRPYLRHRVPGIRLAAARALGVTGGRVAVAALREGLSSHDKSVRGLSASGLGVIADERVLPELFLALDRDVPEAVAAIGRLCGPNACRTLVDKLDKSDLDILSNGVSAILFRPSPLPEDEQLVLVERLRDAGTPEALDCLRQIASRWPASGSARVKHAITSALAAMQATHDEGGG